MPDSASPSSIRDYIAVVVIILMAIGTVFVFSASANIGNEPKLHQFYDFPGLLRILLLPLAVVVLYAGSCFNYRWFSLDKRWFKSLTVWLLIPTVVLLIMVLIPKFGTEINQARRWFRINTPAGVISFQPSELAKWALIFFLAAFCDKFRDDMGSYWKRFVPACLVIALMVGLTITQDFGTAAFLLLLGLLMLIIGGAKFWHILTLVPFGVIGFGAVLLTAPGRIRRIAAFLDPEKWAGSAAYQANQSLIALGSGGIFGKGLGKGICKYGHLPEDTTDFVFAIIGEELGLVGTAAVIGLFIIFILLGIFVVVRCKNPFGRLMAAGIILAVAIQAVINIGVVTVVLPTKGIPLPFVSAGGTSMLLTSAAVGLLLNIAGKSGKPLGDSQ